MGFEKRSDVAVMRAEGTDVEDLWRFGAEGAVVLVARVTCRNSGETGQSKAAGRAGQREQRAGRAGF